MIPVLVEMDTATVSPTGRVLAFCREKCRRDFQAALLRPRCNPAIKPAEGCAYVEDDYLTGVGAFNEYERCAFCGDTLDDVLPGPM